MRRCSLSPLPPTNTQQSLPARIAPTPPPTPHPPSQHTHQTKRQDQVIKGWLKNKEKTRATRKRRSVSKGRKKVSSGMGAKQQANFKDIRAMFEKRKSDMRKELIGSSGGSGGRTGQRRSRSRNLRSGRRTNKPKQAWGQTASNERGSRLGKGRLPVSNRTAPGRLVEAARSSRSSGSAGATRSRGSRGRSRDSRGRARKSGGGGVAARSSRKPRKQLPPIAGRRAGPGAGAGGMGLSVTGMGGGGGGRKQAWG